MSDLGLTPAEVARRAGITKETVGNYVWDRNEVDHVKAAVLFKIANTVGMSGHQLLYGTPEPVNNVAATAESYPSHPVQLESWKVAFQLVAEALDDRGLTLPPAKRAEVTLLAHDLLIDGLPRARLLQLVQAAAA